MSSAPSAAFTFRLVGTGWAEARLTLGDEWTALTASYLSDALGDLLAAVRKLVQGEASVSVRWAEEPGEFRWVFDRDGDDVFVRVTWQDEWDETEPPLAGDLRIAARVGLSELVRAVSTGAREALDLYGVEGYAERWIDFAFPLEDLTALEEHSRI